ncbi:MULTISPECIES: hypothetical protein [unclassified Aminobacter]|uniref:hypothetical protein n=1 Tax=unclassified Aminobacter TaxID=2644704 RepID=UPI000465F449|nr:MULTISPECIES: hypothetical protein [unclassified Aminobacter]TWH35895.1 hypothetical protein L611_001100000020 [Aminobacter sp. J15]
MFGLSTVKLYALAAMGAAILLTWSHVSAYRAGAEKERAATLSRSVEALRERTRVDEKISNMDDRGLCAALGGLPDECNGLDL